MRKRVFAAVVIALLLVGLTLSLDTLALSTQPATVRASLTAGTTRVTNNVTITPESISLGSVFDANGQVSAGGKPLANAQREAAIDAFLSINTPSERGTNFFC
jgi:hypothetical protein